MAQLSELDKQREAIDLEIRQLQLEEMRESAELRRSKRTQRTMTREATEAALADSRAQQEAREEYCPHRKGGKDLEGLNHGSSNNYSVIKHTFSHGGTMVLCQRCQKQWLPPVRSEYKTQPEYTAALKDYRKALDFPTDNAPSGTRLFAVENAA